MQKGMKDIKKRKKDLYIMFTFPIHSNLLF